MSITKSIYNNIVKIICSNISLDLMIPFNITKQSQSIGAGFFINEEGIILTAAHVLEDSIEIWIRVPEMGKKIYKGKIISVFPDFDIGVLQIIGYKNKDFLKLGSSKDIKLKDDVYTLGYPSNSDYPISTSGTISGRRDFYIQTDTPLNPGNSGGPLLNEENEVVGINSAKIAELEGSSLIVPIDYVINNLELLLNPGKKRVIQRNVLGIVEDNGNDTYNSLLGINIDGVIVRKVLDKSPLKGKIELGDIIMGLIINGKTYDIDYYGEITVEKEEGKVPYDYLISRLPIGSEIVMKVYSIRKRKKEMKRIKLLEFNKVYPIYRIFPHLDKIDYEIFGGMILMDLRLNHLEIPEFLSLLFLIKNNEIYKKHLLITHIFPNSKISEYSIIGPGELIGKINGYKVNSLDDFRKAIRKPIIKDSKKYVTIETEYGTEILLSLKDLIEQEKELIENFGYKPSKSFQFLEKNF